MTTTPEELEAIRKRDADLANLSDEQLWSSARDRRYLLSALKAAEERAEKAEASARDMWRRGESALRAENEKLREALTRLVRVYEAEHDPDTISRPDWLDAALKEKPNDEG